MFAERKEDIAIANYKNNSLEIADKFDFCRERDEKVKMCILT